MSPLSCLRPRGKPARVMGAVEQRSAAGSRGCPGLSNGMVEGASIPRSSPMCRRCGSCDGQTPAWFPSPGSSCLAGSRVGWRGSVEPPPCCAPSKGAGGTSRICLPLKCCPPARNKSLHGSLCPFHLSLGSEVVNKLPFAMIPSKLLF